MKFYLNSKDYSVSNEEFQLLLDVDLDMLVTDPQPKELSKYYESKGYISHTDTNKTIADKIYQRVKRYNLGKKVGLIDRYSKANKELLDVGAGTGDFLVAAKQRGWSVVGIEPNTNARERAKKKGIALKTGFKSLGNRKFQLITLWHVLEHLPNLKKQIQTLKSHLNDNGVLVIAVPNFKSYDAQYYGKFWAAYDLPRHLWHFSRTSIKKLFAQQGIKVVKTKPMVFDSFYVSLLSERYKTKKQNFITAFFIGIWSNICAWKTKEYSSIIYVLKKA